MRWAASVTVTGMWVRCPCGRRHWGTYGAAGIVLRDGAGRLLMTHRSWFVHFPSTWAFPGGALERNETPVDAALRELDEEIGVPADAVTVVTTLTGTDHEIWRYTYVIANLLPQWTRLGQMSGSQAPRMRLNFETQAVSWVSPADMAALRLHPDLATDLPALHAALGAV
jgi:8-oxo-dGTP pyrophosphatase MutT (NUDIX family)